MTKDVFNLEGYGYRYENHGTGWTFARMEKIPTLSMSDLPRSFDGVLGENCAAVLTFLFRVHASSEPKRIEVIQKGNRISGARACGASGIRGTFQGMLLPGSIVFVESYRDENLNASSTCLSAEDSPTDPSTDESLLYTKPETEMRWQGRNYRARYATAVKRRVPTMGILRLAKEGDIDGAVHVHDERVEEVKLKVQKCRRDVIGATHLGGLTVVNA
ncbi:hypothetical protein QBC37DRAFT_479276 [Rhypophila decipiens]|uniref:Uncharacterized protein n=1 Tax=Rhypophila decipiens TaxID=261697 RepID=A0AAN7BEC1_9PEZI|nr:hypothetical protein QBC37DRAFT_479276 [Rhypophila decipiens]